MIDKWFFQSPCWSLQFLGTLVVPGNNDLIVFPEEGHMFLMGYQVFFKHLVNTLQHFSAHFQWTCMNVSLCKPIILCCTVCAGFVGMVSVKTQLLAKTQFTVIRSRTQSQCFCPGPSAAAQLEESHFPERFTELFLESVKLEVCVGVFSHLSVAVMRRDIFPRMLCCRGIS